ncbi:WD40 repeat domain-containing protein [Roseimicrobium gellanilyticum]|nr:WD40 repeat domain-containing protein [Roseimicrobium gellanilyticum]
MTIETLEAMRQHHLELMEASPESPPEQIQAFLAAGMELGAKLSARKDRAEAQSMLNYWAATLAGTYSVQDRVASAEMEAEAVRSAGQSQLERGRTKGVSRETTQESDGGLFGVSGFVALKPFDEGAVVRQAREGLARLDKGTEQEQAEVEQLMPALVRMDETSHDVHLAMLREDDSLLQGQGWKHPAVVRLQEAGLLIPASPSETGKQQMVLAGEFLLQDWKALEKYRTNRRAFRQMARGWENSGKQSSALLTKGTPLRVAETYRDRNEYENAFLDKSRTAATRMQQGMLSIAAVVIALLGTLSVWLFLEKAEADAARKKAEQALAELKTATALAETRRVEAEKATTLAENRRIEVEKAFADLKAAMDAKTTAEAEAATLALVNAEAEKAKALEQAKEVVAMQKRLAQELENSAKLRVIVDSGQKALGDLNRLKPVLNKQTLRGEEQILSQAVKDLERSFEQAQSVQKATDQSLPQVEQAVKDAQQGTLERQPILIKTLTGHQRGITAVQFFPDGRLATAGGDNDVRLWNADGSSAGEPIPGSSRDGVNCLAANPKGQEPLLAIGSNGSTVRLFNFTTRQTAAYDGHLDAITCVAFSPDGKRILSTSGDRSVQIWNPREPGKPALFNAQKLGSIVTWAAFDPAGNRVVASLDEPAKAAFLWDLSSNPADRKILQMDAPVKRAVFSPDGTLVLGAGSGDKTAGLWDAATGTPKARLRGHEGPVWQAIFRPDGKQVATASGDTTIRVWDVADGALLRTLRGHEGEVRHLACSPDGEVLASGSIDGIVKLWFGKDTMARNTLTGHERRITAVAFSPDGNRLATGSQDSTVRLWNLNAAPPVDDTTIRKGWSLYGWLEEGPPPPKFRGQSFAPVEGPRGTMPEPGSVVVAEATMNIRDKVALNANGQWDQGKPVGFIFAGEKVRVIERQGGKPGEPPGVWILFEKL